MEISTVTYESFFEVTTTDSEGEHVGEGEGEENEGMEGL